MAGFSEGEAEELHRAMGFKRSSERMGVIEGRLQKKDGTLSIRAERFERMSPGEPFPEPGQPLSPPYPRHRPQTPPSRDSR